MEATLILKKLLLKWYFDNGVKFSLNNLKRKKDFETDRNLKTITCSNSNKTYPDNSNDILNNCNSLKELEDLIKNSVECGLKITAKNTVFSDGNSEAKVMLLGEAPGEEEDRKGKPFVGQAGILLDKMLGAIGQDRKNTYISNIIFWRPPGNRKPTEEEISICLPYVFKHIELIKPKILILAGATASKAVYGIEAGITQIRGNWKNIAMKDGHNLKTMAIFHPAFLLRQPARKKEAWEDLKKIKIEINKHT